MMKPEESGEMEPAPIEAIEDKPDRDVGEDWTLDVFVVSGSNFLIVLGLLTTLRRRFARWRVRNTADGALLTAIVDEDRAVNAAQSFFGPNVVALGLIGLIAVSVGRLTSC